MRHRHTPRRRSRRRSGAGCSSSGSCLRQPTDADAPAYAAPRSPQSQRRTAEWEREDRISRAVMTTYEVQGWRQSTGQIWRHNHIVRVVDPIIGFDRDMLIAEIEYSQSNSAGKIARFDLRRFL
ncbi:phage baseplate assembly protein [Burkholderia dolosa]|uniref:phage baseplate assembly protein n=1 Tax=Burkholderia dolosa TaxID=152500 RepID=UPI003D15FC6D